MTDGSRDPDAEPPNPDASGESDGDEGIAWVETGDGGVWYDPENGDAWVSTDLVLSSRELK